MTNSNNNSWYSYGFPDAHETGLFLSGVVTSSDGNVEGTPAIQLDCDQGGHGYLTGSSGAPVIIDGFVVGVVRFGILKQSVVFATSTESIRSSFGDDWYSRTSDNIAHPLLGFPRGPMVKLHEISSELVDAFSNLYGEPSDANDFLNRAIRLRLSANPNDESVTYVRTANLPKMGITPPAAWWQAVLYQACRHGPRMLAAILLCDSGDQFTAIAQKERKNLLNLLSRYS